MYPADLDQWFIFNALSTARCTACFRGLHESIEYASSLCECNTNGPDHWIVKTDVRGFHARVFHHVLISLSGRQV